LVEEVFLGLQKEFESKAGVYLGENSDFFFELF